MIPAIVLAAGKSSRMGRPKAALPLAGGDTFITRIVRTLLDGGVDDVVVVVGHEGDAVAASFAASGLPARFVVNPEYDRGQLSPYLLAKTYAVLGESGRVLPLLAEAVKRREVVAMGLRIEHDFQSLHGDSRFAALVAREGLPPLSAN